MASTALFRTAKRPLPPADLLGGILTRINKERKNIWQRKMLALIVAATASIAGLAFALYATIASFARSGAPAFLKLIVTDTGAVAAYWKDFTYFLLETIPAGGLAVALALAAVVAIVMRTLIRTARSAQAPHAFTL